MNDMKNKLTAVMKSCSESSPSVAASMVKFHNNKLVSYGGVFCVQVPFQKRTRLCLLSKTFIELLP